MSSVQDPGSLLYLGELQLYTTQFLLGLFQKPF